MKPQPYTPYILSCTPDRDMFPPSQEARADATKTIGGTVDSGWVAVVVVAVLVLVSVTILLVLLLLMHQSWTP